MAEPIIPPKRGELSTPKGLTTTRFQQWIESLTRQSNETTGEVSETSELISSDSGIVEEVEGLGNELALVTPSPIEEPEVITANADFTTTGSQIIICTNTTDITITLNATPDDVEQVHIVRQNTGAVTVSGAINGDTTLTIGNRYSSPHLVFTIDADEWNII